MKKIRELHAFLGQDGATVIEYALVASLISIAIILGVTAVGEQMVNTYNFVSEEVGKAN